MSWLSGKELIHTVKRHADKATRDAFGGVFSMDKLPFAVPHYPYFMIINTQAHNLPGEHWISVFIDKDKRGEVFDSFALPLSNTLIRWLNRFSRTFTINHLSYQHPLSATCGAYALFYVFHRLSNSKCVSLMLTNSFHDNERRVLAFYNSLK